MNRDKDQKVEKSIIDRCLGFNEFDHFYNDGWVTRSISIKWIIDSSCPMFAIQSFHNKKNPFIVLQRLPETRDDAFLVAHEMGHVIKYFDKQYLSFERAPTPIAKTYIGEEITDMGNRLGSMLDDPLIDSFLQEKYGFDPAHFYTNVLIPDTIEGLDSFGDPPHEWHVFKKALFYSQFSLQWDSIKGDGDALHKWDLLKEKYKICRPKVTRIGEELHSLARATGYDTIEKQRQIFNKIFNSYRINSIKLGDILRMSN